ncbi:MAG TPA: hypothetical protein VFE88_01375 [Candidatus Nanoarchaeia archaeon]|nr:hypothetical protein [Candidatus Nanoarchaeia archaeon]
MGQYFIIVNLRKREYIHPHDLKRGAKLLEISKDPIIYGLMSLLQAKNKEKTALHLGSWANDKILFIGDSEDSSFFKQVVVSFKNISKEAYNEYLNFSINVKS